MIVIYMRKEPKNVRIIQLVSSCANYPHYIFCYAMIIVPISLNAVYMLRKSRMLILLGKDT